MLKPSSHGSSFETLNIYASSVANNISPSGKSHNDINNNNNNNNKNTNMNSMLSDRNSNPPDPPSNSNSISTNDLYSGFEFTTSSFEKSPFADHILDFLNPFLHQLQSNYPTLYSPSPENPTTTTTTTTTTKNINPNHSNNSNSNNDHHHHNNNNNNNKNNNRNTSNTIKNNNNSNNKSTNNDNIKVHSKLLLSSTNGIESIITLLRDYCSHHKGETKHLMELMNVERLVIPYIELDLPGSIILEFNNLEEDDPMVESYQLSPAIGEQIRELGVFLDRYDIIKEVLCLFIWSSVDRSLVCLPSVGLIPYPLCWHCKTSFGLSACCKCGGNSLYYYYYYDYDYYHYVSSINQSINPLIN